MAKIQYGVNPDIFKRAAQKKAKIQYGVKPDIFKITDLTVQRSSRSGSRKWKNPNTASCVAARQVPWRRWVALCPTEWSSPKQFVLNWFNIHSLHPHVCNWGCAFTNRANRVCPRRPARSVRTSNGPILIRVLMRLGIRARHPAPRNSAALPGTSPKIVLAAFKCPHRARARTAQTALEAEFAMCGWLGDLRCGARSATHTADPGSLPRVVVLPPTVCSATNSAVPRACPHFDSV